MKRETALEVIRIDVAQNGEVTETGLRAYVENRISKEAFNRVVEKGYNQFKGLQTKKMQECGHVDYEFKKGKCWKCSYPAGVV